MVRRGRDGAAPGDALAYLGETYTVFDAIYSVFGAGWFSDPGLLLPIVHANLKPGGVFAFSQRPPVEGCYGCQASYIPRGLMKTLLSSSGGTTNQMCGR